MHIFKVSFYSSVIALFAVFNVLASERLTLSVGNVHTIKVGSVQQLAVGNDELVSVNVSDTGKVVIIPIKAGETDIVFWTEGHRLRPFSLTILPANMSRQVGLVSSILRSYKDVSVRAVHDQIVLEGKVSPDELEKFETVVSNLSGAISLVKAQFDVKDMIELKVRVLEVDKRYRRELGVNWDDSLDGPVLGTIAAAETNPVFRLFPSGSDTFSEEVTNLIPADSTDVFSFAGIATSISSRIQLIQENNAGRILAEPTLRTRSGEEASFLAGGLLPYSTVNQFGQAQVEFQEYGIQLFIRPSSDSDGNILSLIRAEVSSIDNSVTVQGVPGILTRETESTVNMKSGETIALSGLLSTNDSKTVDKVPLLGDIPVLGNLFKSQGVEEQRTELVVLVTPRIVPHKESHKIDSALQQHLTEMENLMGGSSSFNEDLID